MNKRKNIFLIIGLILPVLMFGLILLTSFGSKQEFPKYNYLYLSSSFNYSPECKEYISLESNKLVYKKVDSILSETPSLKLLCGSTVYLYDVKTNQSVQIKNDELSKYDLANNGNEFSFYDTKPAPDGYRFENYYGRSSAFPFFLGFGKNDYNFKKVLVKNGTVIEQNISGESINFISFIK